MADPVNQPGMGLTEEDFEPGHVRPPLPPEEYERLLAERTRQMLELEEQVEAAIKAHAEMRQLDLDRYQQVVGELRRAKLEIERAFKAGYHCQWIRHERRFKFDPLLKPGEPDGAFDAWLRQQGPNSVLAEPAPEP